jgi:V-type H+-transporting ATPase proteolipid subunit
MVNGDLMTGLGAIFSIFLCSTGACIASIPAGIFAIRSNDGFKAFCPIMSAGVLAIYGIVVAVILGFKLGDTAISESQGYKFFSAGLSVGLACLASGIGMRGFLERYMLSPPTSDDSVSPEREPLIANCVVQPKVTSKLLTVNIFFEAIGLHGLIVALFLLFS